LTSGREDDVSDNELISRIQRAFSTVFGPQIGFDPELSRAGEAGWTSLKHVELLIALETEFAVRFDGGDATDMVSIPVVIEKVRQKLS
jgi:acyl carrier protein